MDKVKLLIDLFLLIIIVDGIHSDTKCDCASLSDGQEFLRAKLNRIEFDNFKIKSRLRRLEVSKVTSTRPNDEISTKASEQNEDTSISNEIPTNNSKRIDTIESALAKVMTILELNTTNKLDVHGDGEKHRLDKIETELAKISNKVDNSIIVRYDRTLKQTIRAEKNKRIKFEFRVREIIESVKDFSRNYTGETDEKIYKFENEVLKKHERVKDEIMNEAIKMNQTIYKHINHIDLIFDTLQNGITETEEKLSILENATVKDKTDGGWGSWGSYGTCSDSCGRGVKLRIRTCTNPKPSLKGQYCKGSPVQAEICNKNTCPDNRVFFTAYDLLRHKGYNIDAIFSRSYENYGSGYDTSTGKFTCKVPGIYMFSFQISKRWEVETDYLRCAILRNNDIKVRAMGDPHGDDKDGYSISLTAVLYLGRNDVVNVGNCVGIEYSFYSTFSSFTGVLVTPDNS